MNCQAESETLERYAIGGLPQKQQGELEEHLLVCDECREELVEMESYVAAMRSAGQQYRQRENVRAGWLQRAAWIWQPLPAVAVAVLLLTVLAGGWLGTRVSHPAAPLAVLLEATRGSESAQVPAGRPLTLTVDLTELPVFPAYRVEVVNGVGAKMAELNASPAAGKLQATVPASLESGVYFVRLYSPQAELLREYALEIKTPSALTSPQ